MQAILVPFQKVCKQLCRCAIFAPSFLLGWASDIFADFSLFIRSKNVWYLTSIQDVVYIFKEAFLLDLGISEGEIDQVNESNIALTISN